MRSPARSAGPTLPNLPTMAEAGVPDFVVTSWCTWVGPAGLPRPIVDKVNAAMKQVAEDPAIQKRFEQIGALLRLEARPRTPSPMPPGNGRCSKEMVRISGARME